MSESRKKAKNLHLSSIFSLYGIKDMISSTASGGMCFPIIP